MQYCSYGTFSSSVLWWVGVLIIKSGLTPSSLKLMLTRLLNRWVDELPMITPFGKVDYTSTPEGIPKNKRKPANKKT